MNLFLAIIFHFLGRGSPIDKAMWIIYPKTKEKTNILWNAFWTIPKCHLSTFLILKLLNNKSNISNLIRLHITMWGLSVMISRWVFKCHTVQQILIGAMLGSFWTVLLNKDYVFCCKTHLLELGKGVNKVLSLTMQHCILQQVVNHFPNTFQYYCKD